MIERDAKTCGGKPRIAGTRIGVHDIVSNLRHLSGNVEVLLAQFPDLSEPQVSEALAYYDANREEIDEILLLRDEAYCAGLTRSRTRRQRDLATASR